MNLKLSDIRIDGGTQARVSINEEAVAEYAERLSESVPLPDVVVFFDGADHWLADGFHRFHATKRIGAVDIPADVRQGTNLDAQMYAFGANQAHGLRRTNADKRKAVEGMVGICPGMSDRAIANHCGVSHTLVTGVRKPEYAERQAAAKKGAAAKAGVESDYIPTSQSGIPAPPAKPDATSTRAAAPEVGTTVATEQASTVTPEQRAPGPVASVTELEPAGADSGEGDAFDALGELERVMAENERLRQELKVCEASDLQAEALKWRRAYDNAQRQLDDKMSAAARLERELQQLSARMVRIGRLFDERDATKIPAKVEAFVRKHKQAA